MRLELLGKMHSMNSGPHHRRDAVAKINIDAAASVGPNMRSELAEALAACRGRFHSDRLMAA